MKKSIKIAALVGLLLLYYTCREEEPIILFGPEMEKVEFGALGGMKEIAISSQDKWIASADQPWITVSPANGKGSTNIQVIVDSTLKTAQRIGSIRIQNLNSLENKDISVTQTGFEFVITPEKSEISIESFEILNKRYFDILVTSNIEFDVDIAYTQISGEVNQNWLKNSPIILDLDKGARPRSSKVRFEWDINSHPEERIANIKFKPKKNEIVLAEQNELKVIQKAAQKIVPGHTGDSLAIMAIHRAFNSFSKIDFSEKMENWSIVTMWKETDEGYDLSKHKGRVRSVTFMGLSTKESIPNEIQYLDAAEEISIKSNGNIFLLSLSTGEYITRLKNLKKLTIFGYGLTELHPDFVHLQNLEELSLSGNNFQKIPEILNPVNFPKLKKLDLGANRRYSISDLSNSTKTDIGGLNDHNGIPRYLLEWNNLEELTLSYNFMHGEIPDMKDWPKYTAQDLALADTLPQYLVDHNIPKVLPKMKRFAVNLNQFSGKLPDWLLYHPALDIFYPYSLIFTQEGWTKEGVKGGFSNEPINLDYYYDIYTKKKRPGTVTY